MTASFRDLLVAISSSAGALTGLLFVAMSVTPHRDKLQGPRIIHQVRAAAAILAFTNALAVSLFTLVPGTNVAVPALVFGVTGIFFTAASARSIRASNATERQQRQQIGLMFILLAIFGTELIAGSIGTFGRTGTGTADAIGYALVASIIFGISRAWEFVGDIDTGLGTSLAVLVGLRKTALPRGPEEPGSAAPQAADPPAPDPSPENQPSENRPAES
jgi:hypothetical protein